MGQALGWAFGIDVSRLYRPGGLVELAIFTQETGAHPQLPLSSLCWVLETMGCPSCFPCVGWDGSTSCVQVDYHESFPGPLGWEAFSFKNKWCLGIPWEARTLTDKLQRA